MRYGYGRDTWDVYKEHDMPGHVCARLYVVTVIEIGKLYYEKVS
jgi:hypothetical protein